MSIAALFDSPWPAEDSGPARLQTPRSGEALGLRAGETLGCTTRDTLLSTMTVLGSPGEVFLLTHSALRSHLGLPTTSCVERIDPVSLKTLFRSPRLPGGPMWPGGMAVHGNGDLYVVYGRFAHRLNRQCELLASFKLPVNQPYNSFVVLGNGLIVTKNLSRTDAAVLTVIDPANMRPVGSGLACPEPSVARLSAVAFDSANSYLRAWRFDRERRCLQALWEKHPFGAASHMILYPNTGELVVNDYRRFGEEVVVLNIESGAALARVRVGGLTQGVVFPSVGWGRDLYWSSLGRLAHVFVE